MILGQRKAFNDDGDMSDIDDVMRIDDDLSDADIVIDDRLTSKNGERNSSNDNQVDLKQGDCVKVITENYLSYFASVTDNGCVREIEINYVEGKNKWEVLNEMDLDLRDRGDLKKVDNFIMDKRSHYFFK